MVNPVSPSSRRLAVCFVEFQHVTHVFLTTEEYGTPFVDVLRNEVKDALCACRRKPSRLCARQYLSIRVNIYDITDLLCQECHRECLIKHPKFA